MSWYDQPGTTDIKGAAYGNPTVAEAGNRLGEANARALAQNAGDALAASSRGEVAARTADDIRGTGTLTKYRPIGGWQEGRGGPAAPGGGGAPGGRLAAVSEFGEPTSYEGGVGAPAPVQVIKGMRTSYVNPTPDNGTGGFTPVPGTGPREFTTPLEAGQSFNQATGVGQYRAPGQTLMEATAVEARKTNAEANKRPDLVEASAKSVADRAGQDLLGKATSLYGTPGTKLDPKTGKTVETGQYVLHPEVQKLLMGNMPQNLEDVGPTLERLKPEIDTIHAVDKFNNPTTSPDLRTQVVNNYRQQMTAAGQPVNPDWEQYLSTAPVTRANLSQFQKLQTPPASAPAPAIAPAPATPGSQLATLTPEEEAAQAAGSFAGVPTKPPVPGAMGGYFTGKDQRTPIERQRDAEEAYRNRLM